MLRIRHILMALPLALISVGCTPAGCSGEDPEQDKPADEQFVGAVEQSLPRPDPNASQLYGTWKGPQVPGHFDLLVLMTNGRYHSAEAVTCVKAPCDPIVHEGAFKLYTREARTFFELERTGSVPLRYEYAISENKLRLRPLVQGSEWFVLEDPGIAWCSNDRECTVQALPPGVCSGRYVCGQNACAWKCAALDHDTAAVPDTDTAGAVNAGDTQAP